VLPTAVHAAADVQETAFKTYPGLWEVGVGWMRHPWPFQRSTSVPKVVPPLKALKPPTAVQFEGEVQETPSRPLEPAPAGLGVGSIAQTLPFQRSASVPKVDSPTAIQEKGDMHEMPSSCAPRDPAELSVRCRCQLWPFQRCAIVSGVPEPFENRENPNAVHAVEDGQATPKRKLPCFGLGLRVGWMFHAWPFQRSASVAAGLPELSKPAPTAVHADRDEQSTPFKNADSPGGLGVGSMRHLEPFQRSASVPTLDPPTAVHDDEAVQATPNRRPPPAAGLGVLCTLQLRPFQRTASVPEFEPPTAMQDDGAVHDTSPRKPPAELGAR
jgi:hypothetical protein